MSPMLCAASGAVFASLLATAAHAAGDAEFLKTAMMGDNSEVALGMIAQQRASFPQTRAFGGMLVMDHSAAKIEALKVARAHGVPDTDALAPEARKEERKLSGLAGPMFDREFARYMVKDHQEDIAAFEKQARRGDPATAGLARAALPALHRHLDTAQSLAR